MTTPVDRLVIGLVLVAVVTSCVDGDGAAADRPPADASVGPVASSGGPVPAPAPRRATATHAGPTTRVDDATGDVTDPDGGPPPDRVGAADLVAVELSVDAGELLVRFELMGAPPRDVGSLLWSVRTERAGDPVLTISAQQVGPEVFGAVYDWTTQRQRQLAVDIEGSTVAVAVPLDAVEDVGHTWSALVQLDGAYEDTTGPATVPPTR